jgi:hypothetical protein
MHTVKPCMCILDLKAGLDNGKMDPFEGPSVQNVC